FLSPSASRTRDQADSGCSVTSGSSRGAAGPMTALALAMLAAARARRRSRAALPAGGRHDEGVCFGRVSVYREPEGRPPTPPTVITYRTYVLRLRGWMLAAVFSLLGLVLLAMIHATHIECTRSGGQDGVCVVSSYGMIVAERRRVLPLAD